MISAPQPALDATAEDGGAGVDVGVVADQLTGSLEAAAATPGADHVLAAEECGLDPEPVLARQRGLDAVKHQPDRNRSHGQSLELGAPLVARSESLSRGRRCYVVYSATCIAGRRGGVSMT